MQRKLATWSATDQERKFDRLLRLIAHPVWLAEAARVTLASLGAKSPGIDGMDKSRLAPLLAQELERLRAELLAGAYHPAPARRVYILKATGQPRPLGIPTLRDRIVQRAMLMAMEPIWESDFHRDSYGFRPQRSVHHAIRTVKLQLLDSTETKGRWVVEGDLTSYFETVHHRRLMRGVRKRIRDTRFRSLLWRVIKAGHVDRGLLRAASEGVPQGGGLSPLRSNIMLHEFDAYLEANDLSKKARTDRWAWNVGIQHGRPITIREHRQWNPAVAYCRYADDCAPRRRRGGPQSSVQPCCTRDEGRPLEAAVQAEASNHPGLLPLREVVVSALGKGRARPCQVGTVESNVSEPLRTCRKRRDDVKTGGESLLRDESGGHLVTGQMASGMKVARRRSRLLCGTWEPVTSMLRENRKETYPKRESTDAKNRDGVTRSSEEGTVMVLERRGYPIWLETIEQLETGGFC